MPLSHIFDSIYEFRQLCIISALNMNFKKRILIWSVNCLWVGLFGSHQCQQNLNESLIRTLLHCWLLAEKASVKKKAHKMYSNLFLIRPNWLEILSDQTSSRSIPPLNRPLQTKLACDQSNSDWIELWSESHALETPCALAWCWCMLKGPLRGDYHELKNIFLFRPIYALFLLW